MFSHCKVLATKGVILNHNAIMYFADRSPQLLKGQKELPGGGERPKAALIRQTWFAPHGVKQRPTPQRLAKLLSGQSDQSPPRVWIVRSWRGLEDG